jgi:glycosyltransferase
LELPKLSIITAGYNSAATIYDTLQCIANQTYSNIEHIIIDGDSKEKTLEIVAEFPHVATVISEPDRGIYDAMNKGIQNATGDIIGILNSDDFYEHQQVLKRVVEKMENSGAATLYGDLVFVEPENTNKIVRYWKAGSYKDKSWTKGWMPPHPTFFVRRKVYDKYGLFDLDLNSAADYELMLRVLYKHKVSTVYLPEVLVRMRTGGQSNANLRNRYLANKEDKLAWAKNNLKPGLLTTYLKPLRKLKQIYSRPK